MKKLLLILFLVFSKANSAELTNLKKLHNSHFEELKTEYLLALMISQDYDEFYNVLGSSLENFVSKINKSYKLGNEMHPLSLFFCEAKTVEYLGLLQKEFKIPTGEMFYIRELVKMIIIKEQIKHKSKEMFYPGKIIGGSKITSKL